jgi:hypothetical protein
MPKVHDALLIATVGLLTGACDPHHAVEEPAAAAAPSPPAPRPVPPGSHEGSPTSLLAQYAPRPPIDAKEAASWELPFQGKRIAVALVTTAALDRLEDLPLIVAPNARWGLPDRREYGARPIFAGDGGAAFFEAFRAAASRLRGTPPELDPTNPLSPGSAVYTCPPLAPGIQQVVRSGAEPYWCFYTSEDKLDLIVFRLRRVLGAARIEYVGLFEERPTSPVQVAGNEPIPPLVPPLQRRSAAPADVPPTAPTPPAP